MTVWGWLIIFDIFLGGLSAGLFIAVAGLEAFSPHKKFERTLTWGAMFALIIIGLGLISLILDLGHPERAVNTMLHPQLDSPMSWGSLSIASFMILILAYWLARTGFIINKILPQLWELLKRFKTPIAALGGVLAFMAGTYTGILLTYARFPLWNSAILPVLFLTSALTTGYALFLAIAKFTGEIEQEGLWEPLPRLLLILGVLEFLLILAYMSFLPEAVRAELLDLGTRYGLLYVLAFLVGGVLVGLITLPLLEIRKSGTMALYIAAPLVIFGGFALRYVIVFLGPLA